MKQGFEHNLFHIHDVFKTHINIYHYSTIDGNYVVFPSNLVTHLHDISLANVLDTFAFVIILSTRRFKSSVLFDSHTLSDKSFRVLQL